MIKIFWLLCLVLLFRPVYAEEKLPVGFLEFLGEWEDENGRWVDPLSLPEAEAVRVRLDENEEQRGPSYEK